MPDLLELAKAIPLGVAAGLFSGAFGVGGGVISTPLLIMLLGVEPHVAVGTTLAMIIPTAVSGAYSYTQKNLFSLRLALATGAPAFLCTIASSYLERSVSGKILVYCLAALMFLVGIDFAAGIGKKLRKSGEEIAVVPHLTREELLRATIVGAFAGFLSGFLGIGGGFILIPLYCYLFRTPIKVAFGTSLLVVAAVSLPGAIIHSTFGHVDLPMTLALLVGSIPGAKIGSHYSTRAADDMLRVVFGVILIVLSILFALK